MNEDPVLVELPDAKPLRPRDRWLRVGLVAAVVVAVVVAVVLVSRSVPAGAVQHAAIVSDGGIAVGPGVAGAVYFPFQITPSAGTSGGTNTGIVNASVTGSIDTVACRAAGPCPGVLVEILTDSQLHALQSGSPVHGVWCYGAPAGCSATPHASFSTPITRDSGAPLNLVLLAPPGATGTVTVSASATLYWTS